MNQVLEVPRGDSAVIPYRLQKADGSFQSLAGYTVTLTVRTSPAAPTTAIPPVTAVARTDDTWADATIAKGQLTTTGRFEACFEADHPSGDHHSWRFTLDVTPHA
jgi:hypothetical protein